MDGISLTEFSLPQSIADLHAANCVQVPRSAGIYLVIQASLSQPEFLNIGTGGWFQQRDPNYPLRVARENWVEGARIEYIGKAAGRSGLRQRLRQLVRFGYGEPAAHRGGRLLSQLSYAYELQVRWQTCRPDQAIGLEAKIIRQFRAAHDDRRPFANMVG